MFGIVFTCFSLVYHKDEVVTPGGWSNSLVDSDIDAFIRNKIPILSDAELMSSRKQVVAGVNYEYKYKKNNSTWIVDVFDQAWTRLRLITQVRKTSETSSNGEVKTQVYAVGT